MSPIELKETHPNDTIIALLQCILDEDRSLADVQSPASYRIDLMRSVLHWKIKELEREKDND